MAAMFVNGSGQNEQSLERTPIDASYQVSLHLAEGFQRRSIKCEKLTDDRRRTPSDGKSVKSPKSNLFQDKSALYHIMSHL